MPKAEILAGLDLGSGRVTCAIGSHDPQTRQLKILGASTTYCRGLKGGVVVNIPEASRAITRAVEEAENAAGATVHDLILGVRGSHVQSFNNRGAYNIARTDKEITEEDVVGVIENAKAIPISSDREILHVIPQGFSLDRQRGVPNPVGMEGSLLEVEVHIVTVSSSHLNNMGKAVAEAGFKLVESVYSLLALGELMVTSEEKEQGVLLVDVGGQTISLGVYSEGGLRYSKEIPLGADFITRDLAWGLRTSMSAAQRIKEEHGVAHPDLLNGGTGEIAYPGMDGRTTQKAKTRTLVDMILPRVEEIFSVIGDDLNTSNHLDLVIPGGAVLTGGGSGLRGMTQAGTQVLGMPVRSGIPPGSVEVASEEYLQPSYATAVGLVHHAVSGTWTHHGPKTARPRWKRRFLGFLNDLF